MINNITYKLSMRKFTMTAAVSVAQCKPLIQKVAYKCLILKQVNNSSTKDKFLLAKQK